MTPEQKMQAVVEAAGECYHLPVTPDSEICRECRKRGTTPNPEDLNELFRLADIVISKLDPLEYDQSYFIERQRPEDKEIYPHDYIAWVGTRIEVRGADTPAAALLSALYDAVKEVE